MLRKTFTLRNPTIQEAADNIFRGGKVNDSPEIHKKWGINKFKDRVNDVKEMYSFRQYQKKEKGERFGKEYHTWWQWLVGHSWIFLGLSIVGTNYIYYHERSRREDYMNNIDVNRKRFYGKIFENEYMPYSPTKLYDGPSGYIQVDHVTGIETNTDGKVVAPNIEELRKNIAKTEITSDMVSAIAELREQQYSSPENIGKRPPDRKKLLTY
jgi:hypothetical protein